MSARSAPGRSSFQWGSSTRLCSMLTSIYGESMADVGGTLREQVRCEGQTLEAPAGEPLRCSNWLLFGVTGVTLCFPPSKRRRCRKCSEKAKTHRFPLDCALTHKRIRCFALRLLKAPRGKLAHWIVCTLPDLPAAPEPLLHLQCLFKLFSLETTMPRRHGARMTGIAATAAFRGQGCQLLSHTGHQGRPPSPLTLPESGQGFFWCLESAVPGLATAVHPNASLCKLGHRATHSLTRFHGQALKTLRKTPHTHSAHPFCTLRGIGRKAGSHWITI